MNQSDFVLTGVPGVDELLGGQGIPRGYAIFVLGGPGSGKTTFALQFLKEGADKFGENGVYVSLDEDVNYLRVNARRVGVDLEPLEKENKIVLIDSSPVRRLPGEIKLGELTIGRREFTLLSLIDIMKRNVSNIGAKRLIVDPVATLSIQFPNEVDRRTAVLDLMRGIAETGCTTLLISELAESSLDRTYQFEEYLAQGVIMMRKLVRPGGILRVFQVEKMRGLAHDDQPHPYKIEEGGIVVYPTEVAL